jgi:hypothetical protein
MSWTSKKKASQEKQHPVLVLEPNESINAIDLKNENGVLSLKIDEKGIWFVTQPLSARADAEQVKGLLYRLTQDSRGKTISDAQQQTQEFGLAAPSRTLTFYTQSGKTGTLRLGRRAPVGERYYANWDHEKTIFLMDAPWAESVFRAPEEYRYRNVFEFPLRSINQISVARAQQVIEFTKEKNQWRTPQAQDVVDEEKIEDFLYLLSALRVKEFVEQPTTLDAALVKRLAQPDVLVTLKWGNSSAQLRLVGPEDKKKAYLAQGGSQDGFVWIDERQMKGFPQSKNDFLDRTLFDFEAFEVKSIQCEYGGLKKIAQKKEGHWLVDGKLGTEADQTMAEWIRLVSQLQYLDRKDKSEVKSLAVVTPFHFKMESENGKMLSFSWYSLGEKSCLVAESSPSVYFLLDSEIKMFEALAKPLMTMEAPQATTTHA